MTGTRRDLIFDLDGTLIDSAPDLAHALNRLLAELGRPPLELATVRRMIGDGAPARKPDPRHLLAGLALVGAGPEQAVMIGDGINDVDAAKAAGIPMLLLESGYGEIAASQLGGDRLLAGFGDIPEALAELP